MQRTLYLTVALNKMLHLLFERSVLHFHEGACRKMLCYYDRRISCLEICLNDALCIVTRTAADVLCMAMKLGFVFVGHRPLL